MSILNEIKQIIERITQLPLSQLSENVLLSSLENWDSLTALQVMTLIENTFSIKLPIYKFIEAKTVSDLVSLVNQ